MDGRERDRVIALIAGKRRGPHGSLRSGLTHSSMGIDGNSRCATKHQLPPGDRAAPRSLSF
ncbi:hypothetical protein B0G81_2921 [Paraburkholderia sp. BL6665CI2N2]|nr:hypothetical protein B0G81_2921 [Paraburkholderia sp. BL6665CI2N2]